MTVPIPQGWRSITVGRIMQLMSNADQEKLLKLVKGGDIMDRINELKRLFGKYEKELKGIGILPEFLAYSLAYTISTGTTWDAGTEVGIATGKKKDK